MTPVIKRRVEQLQHGEVPEGYKKTKVGVVPNDWYEDSLGKYLREFKKLSNDIDSYPVYSSSRQGLIPQSQYYDKREAVETNLGYKVVPNEYVTYRHMSDDDIFHFNINETGGEILVSSEYPVFTASSKGELGFIIPMLNGTARFRYFCRMQKMGGTRTRLYYKNLCVYKAAFPSLVEQKRIAEILSTQDKLITLKEKLIEEKKRQKKALMQQLLSGKKRLPGYTGEWLFVRANQIFKNVTDKKHDGTLEVLSVTQDKGIVPRSQLDIDIKYAEESLTGYKKVMRGNFVISLRSFQGGIEYSKYTGIVSPAYTVLTSMYPIEDNYYKQFFKSVDYINRLNIAVYGIRDGKQISYEDFGRIKIPYPPIDEQKAIATVLEKADQEIDLLLRSLDQEKQKKKALMQLLLTGIVRV